MLMQKSMELENARAYFIFIARAAKGWLTGFILLISLCISQFFRPIPTIAKALETFTASRVFVGTPDAIRTHDLQSWCCLSNG